MSNEHFEEMIIKDISDMKALLNEMVKNQAAFEKRIETAMVETNGKLRGNHELIAQELRSYVNKDSCESHRSRTGERLEKLERFVELARSDLDNHLQDSERSKTTFNEALVAWAPGIVKTLIITGAVVFISSKGYISF